MLNATPSELECGVAAATAAAAEATAVIGAAGWAPLFGGVGAGLLLLRRLLGVLLPPFWSGCDDDDDDVADDVDAEGPVLSAWLPVLLPALVSLNENNKNNVTKRATGHRV